ncbi:helix-turn-helix domain-containing protein [Puia sp. P3]
MSENVILSPKEAADILKVDVDTIYLKCKKKELPHFRIGKLL